MEPVSTFLTLAIPEAIKEWQDGKKELVNECLRSRILSEVRAGDLDALQRDKLFSMAYQLQDAALKGASKNKLLLMADLISGAIKEESINTDKGVYLASIISDMSDVEIALAARFYQLSKDTSFGYEALKSSNPYGTVPQLVAALSRLTRTGLVQPVSGYSALQYSVTPLMDELVNLSEIEKFRVTF